jgi:hypothetical protein
MKVNQLSRAQELAASCQATAKLYCRVGYLEPWIGYVAVVDNREVGGGIHAFSSELVFQSSMSRRMQMQMQMQMQVQVQVRFGSGGPDQAISVSNGISNLRRRSYLDTLVPW